jgi:hypothetical protein
LGWRSCLEVTIPHSLLCFGELHWVGNCPPQDCVSCWHRLTSGSPFPYIEQGGPGIHLCAEEGCKRRGHSFSGHYLASSCPWQETLFLAGYCFSLNRKNFPYPTIPHDFFLFTSVASA